MKRNALSAKFVATAPLGEHRDGAGLCLDVRPSSKSWLHRYTLNGNRNCVILGKYPNMDLSAARIASEENREKIGKGIDPKTAKILESSITFETVADLWISAYGSKIKEKTAHDAMRKFELHCTKILKVPVNQITSMMIVEMLRPLEKKGQLEQVQRVVQKIGQVLRHAKMLGLVEYCVADRLGEAFKTPEVTSQLTIEPAKLKDLFINCLGSNMTRATQDLLLWQLLTAVRPAEAVTAQWTQIDGNLWTIPKENTKITRAALTKAKKNKEPNNVVYLSTFAKKVLADQVQTSSLFVFAGRDPKVSANRACVNVAIKRAGMHNILVSHGFRSIFSTWANEARSANGYNSDAIEACLFHIDTNKVRSAYNNAGYAKDRMAVMEGWGNYVQDAWQQAQTEYQAQAA
jgi:integrase